MKIKTTLCIILAIIGPLTCAISLTAAQNSENASSEESYVVQSNQVWQQYSEDLIASSEILDDFVNKNITGREAMVQTIGVYLLTFQATNNINSMKPPEKYADYHNYTVNTLVNLQWYLWNMAKFYETNNSGYAIVARDNFNNTKSWREKAIEERMLYL
jgi:hypothetical protein